MIDTVGLPFPKPGQLAGRLVLSGKKYSSNKQRIWLAQGKRCARCPQLLPSSADGHKHHVHGRGMGGGKRDDRRVEVLCFVCHNQATIQRREIWQ